jgi:signal transduction histidine kinase
LSIKQPEDDLKQAQRDLHVIHELTLSVQGAADVNEVEQRVLDAVTGDLGFERAVVALVDQEKGVVTAWLGKARDGSNMLAGGLPHPARLPLADGDSVVARALLDGKTRLEVAAPCTNHPYLDAHLKMERAHVFPMVLRENPVGVMLVQADAGAAEAGRLHSLESIASQAAVAVGTTLLCIDRARRFAVQNERIRIARDIHDTVSQSLFGIVYSLEACSRLLPSDPGRVREELAELKQLAQSARKQLRESIMDLWPSEITNAKFEQDLLRYKEEHCQDGEQLALSVEVSGALDRLQPRLRRSLYRIAQEAVTNTTRHASAAVASVMLRVGDGNVQLTVQDDGHGFEPEVALARERNREHFGLRGMIERAESFGGSCRFISQPGVGAKVRVSIPVGGDA